MITSQTTLNELFEFAKNSTKDLIAGEEYIVRDLFKGFEWNRIARSNRTKLGSMYFAYAQNSGSKETNPLGKTLQNQQRYIKV